MAEDQAEQHQRTSSDLHLPHQRQRRVPELADRHSGLLPAGQAGFSQSHLSRQLGQLQRAGLVSCERDGVRTIWSADNALVDDLCALVQNRLRQRLEAQLQHLSAP